MSVTLKDIAQRAGVDATVVSAVLRGSSRVRCSPKTKEKILALVEEMGYCRNAVASALRSGKTRLIGVAMPSPMLPFYAAMMTSIQTILFKAGYTAVFGLWGMEHSMKETFSSLLTLKVDGIITWELPDHPEKLDIPAVYFSPGRKSELLDTVMIDVENTAARAVEFLKAGLFRKVGIIANLEDSRSIALKEQCGSCGIQIRPEWMFQCLDTDADTAERISKAFSNLKEKPELLVFTDDKVCADSACAMKRHGVLPELLCLRNSYLLPLIGQKMTAFDMHEETIAAALVELLLSRLADPSIPARRWKIEAELINISMLCEREQEN